MKETVSKPPLKASDNLRQTVAALGRLLDQATHNIQDVDSEFHEQIEQLQSRFNTQMAEAVQAARLEMLAEQAQLVQELEALRQAAAGWESEKAQLIADCRRANELVEQEREEHRRALAETDEAAAIALERQLATAMDRFRDKLTSRSAEIARVEDLIQATSKVIEDPTVDLSVVIRKNAERTELEWYVKGLKFGNVAATEPA
jgi:hypothetical protein